MASDLPRDISPLCRELMAACTEGDVVRLEAVLEKDPTVGAQLEDSDKLEVVRCVFRQRHLAVVKRLFPAVFCPAILLSTDENGSFDRSPACLALEEAEDTELGALEHLLDAGVEVNATCCRYYVYEGCSGEEKVLLTHAVEMGSDKAIFLLLDRGATCCLEKVMMYACKNLKENVLRRTLELGGVDMTYHNPMRWILPSATVPGPFNSVHHTILISCLENAKGFSRGERQGFDPDIQLTLVKLLLDAGANPNDVTGLTSLTAGHLVSRGHKVELYKLLLQHGWDIHATDSKGWTALHYAVLGNDVTAVCYLLEQGIPVDCRATSFPLVLPVHVLPISGLLHSIFPARDRTLRHVLAKQFNVTKIKVLRCLQDAGGDIEAITETGDGLLTLLCGRIWFYDTLVWLLHQPIRLYDTLVWQRHPPIRQLSSPPLCKVNIGGDVYLTDCLIPAGVQSADLLQHHLSVAIIANNMPEYEAITHAAPYLLQSADLKGAARWIESVERYMNDEEDSSVTDGKADAYLSLMRNPGRHDRAVYTLAVTEAHVAPSLVKLAVYTVRHHLVTCHGRTLYHLIDRLQLPKSLNNLLTLEAFVDYRKPAGARR